MSSLPRVIREGRLTRKADGLVLDPATEHECGCIWGITPTPGGARGFVLMPCKNVACPVAAYITEQASRRMANKPTVFVTDAADMREKLARSGL